MNLAVVALLVLQVRAFSCEGSSSRQPPLTPSRARTTKLAAEMSSSPDSLPTLPRIIRSTDGFNNADQKLRPNGEDESTQSSLSSSFSTKLVVHWDVNETILIGDDAGGDTRDDCLNKVIAKSAFVKIPKEQQQLNMRSTDATKGVTPTHWWDGTPIDGTTADLGKPADSAPLPPLYTGWTWPKGCCPYYRTSLKERSSRFTENDGRMYRALYDKLQDQVSFPYAHGDFSDVLSHIIPAAFETMKALWKRDQPVRFVFRTFGSDLEDIADVVTTFAEGRHPAHADFQAKELRLGRENLFRGRWTDDGEDYQLFSNDGKTLLAIGDEAILDFLATKPVCGIQDDYSHWAKNGYQPWSGKPVWVPSDRGTHHVLLDDNIHNLEDDSIASVRRQQSDGTFRTLSGSETQNCQGLFLIRVPTVEPILDEQWFVRAIDEAQSRFAASR